MDPHPNQEKTVSVTVPMKPILLVTLVLILMELEEVALRVAGVAWFMVVG